MYALVWSHDVLRQRWGTIVHQTGCFHPASYCNSDLSCSQTGSWSWDRLLEQGAVTWPVLVIGSSLCFPNPLPFLECLGSYSWVHLRVHPSLSWDTLANSSETGEQGLTAQSGTLDELCFKSRHTFLEIYFYRKRLKWVFNKVPTKFTKDQKRIKQGPTKCKQDATNVLKRFNNKFKRFNTSAADV